MTDILLILGVALLLTGAAFAWWPLALMLAGALLMAAAAQKERHDGQAE